MPTVTAVPGVATASFAGPADEFVISSTIVAEAANATAAITLDRFSVAVTSDVAASTADAPAPAVGTGGTFGPTVTAAPGDATANEHTTYVFDFEIVPPAAEATAAITAPGIPSPQLVTLIPTAAEATAGASPPVVSTVDGAPLPAQEFRFVIQAAVGSLPSDHDYTWTTIHDTDDPDAGYVRSWGFRRGRTTQLSRIETGTGQFVLNNENGEWDPTYTGSPFYPYVRPMLPIRGYAIVNGVTYPMFLHYTDGFPRKRVGPNYSEVVISTVDGQEGLALSRIAPSKASLTIEQAGVNNDIVFTAKEPGPLGNDITVAFFQTHFRPLRHQRVVITVTGANIRVDYIDGTVQVDEVLAALRADAATMILVDVDNVPGQDGSGDMHPFAETHLAGGDTVAFPEEVGGLRIGRCLDAAGWPASLRQISQGRDYHAALAFPTSEDGKLLTHCQDIAGVCSENGLLYVNGEGKIVFLDRVDKLTAHSTPAAALTDLPSSRDNVVTNPGFETNTTGWSGVGATITRTTAEHHSGVASCQVAVPDADPSQGLYLAPLTIDPGDRYHGSAWVKAPLGLALVFHLWDGASGFNGSRAAVPFTGTGAWQYVECEGVSGTDQMYLLVKTNSVAGTFYVDDVELRAVEYPYVDFVPNQSKDMIVNDAVCTREGGDPQSAYDSDSVNTYRRRSQSFTSTLATDLDVLAAVQAAVIELKDPLERIEQVTVMPGNDVGCWAAMLGIDIGSRVTVKEHPPYGAGIGLYGEGLYGDGLYGGDFANVTDYIIQGLTWQFQPGPPTPSRVTFDLWPADPISNWFILDDPVRGELDAGNRIGR